jgi:hypothetical protein
MVFPERLREELVNEIVGSVLDHLDLFDHDLLLTLHIVRRKRRIAHDVGEDVERERQVLVEHLDVVTRVFLRGKRVELTANRVDRLSNVFGAAARRALEHMCSTKCAMPPCSAVSWRDPASARLRC